ncbi:MAG: hypothetical protein KF764_00090 [Labilithrix sp.]|nr:hypothetical protein [Labilithrix sp.]MBX3222324.1 hypothetical protein [Labilithrix sp.]
MVGLIRQMVVAGVLVGALACSKKTPEPTAVTKPAPPALPPAAAAAEAAIGGDGKLDPNDPKHGTRKLMGLDAPVFVDGKQIAVLRAGEMPALKPIELEGGGRRYKIYEYLEGIGVAPASIKSVHFHGNNDRIASLEGSELRKEKDRFLFSYISGNTGTPLQKWDTDNLKNEFVIHEIRRVTIYVKKPSPAIHPQRQCHVGADGDCTDAIPYADGQIAKGTRVYVDGKMVGFVKRRNVSDDMMTGAAAADPSETKYAIAKLLAGMGVDYAGADSVEIMAGDDVIARATGEKFAALASQTNFTLPKHNHGKVRLHVPAEIQAQEPGVTDRDALVSAVLVYKSTKPATKRDLVTISEDTDLSVQLAAIDDARGRLGRGEQQ